MSFCEASYSYKDTLPAPNLDTQSECCLIQSPYIVDLTDLSHIIFYSVSYTFYFIQHFLKDTFLKI